MNIYKINKKLAFIIYFILDTICVGMGMGVPFFCILLGFPVGFYLTKRLKLSGMDSNYYVRDFLKYGIYTSLLTMVWMILIWGPISLMLVDPASNFRNFGIPMILYDPKISFIGWIILMVFISPFLQLLCTIFASNVTLYRFFKNEDKLKFKEVNEE